MNKMVILKYAKDWVSERAMFSSLVSPLENALSAITGFCENYDGYEGQQEDVDKLVDKVSQYPALDIRCYAEVLARNQPWNFQKLFAQMFNRQ